MQFFLILQCTECYPKLHMNGIALKIIFLENYVEMGRGVLVCDEWTRCTESAELLFVPLNSVHTVTLGWKEESQNVALSVLIEEIEKSI